jgi:hypothetical protein
MAAAARIAEATRREVFIERTFPGAFGVSNWLTLEVAAGSGMTYRQVSVGRILLVAAK